MKLKDVPAEVIEQIKGLLFDRTLENKHEGPWNWKSVFDFDDPELLKVELDANNAVFVLLPLGEKDHHHNITVIKSVMSKDDEHLVLYLKDVTWREPWMEDWSELGFVAMCDRVEFDDKCIYVASFYHEWYNLDEFKALHGQE